MNVRQLIKLLQQCDPAARVTFDYDGTGKEVTSVERLQHGGIELRSDTDGYAENSARSGATCSRQIGRERAHSTPEATHEILLANLSRKGVI
jgi:hypothetical protein